MGRTPVRAPRHVRHVKRCDDLRECRSPSKPEHAADGATPSPSPGAQELQVLTSSAWHPLGEGGMSSMTTVCSTGPSAGQGWLDPTADIAPSSSTAACTKRDASGKSSLHLFNSGCPRDPRTRPVLYEASAPQPYQSSALNKHKLTQGMHTDLQNQALRTYQQPINLLGQSLTLWKQKQALPCCRTDTETPRAVGFVAMGQLTKVIKQVTGGPPGSCHHSGKNHHMGHVS